MIEIIPAIDIINGKCVRLKRGDYEQVTEYSEDPVDMAMRFADHGIRRLHLVDLDGAKAGRVIHYRILERIAARTPLVIDAGGGIKTDEDLKIVFESGASMATGGSIAVKDPGKMEEWLKVHGPERIILGSDFRDGYIAVAGWQESTGESLDGFLEKWISKGITQTICTDIGKDGLLEGPAIAVYSKIIERFRSLKLVASGGVARRNDIDALEEAGIPAVIIGKAIYEGRIGLEELEKYM